MGLILLLIQGLTLIIVVDALSSWFVPSREQFPRNITSKITEPLYAPFRSLVDPQRTGGFDLTPIIVILLLQLLRGVVLRLF